MYFSLYIYTHECKWNSIKFFCWISSLRLYCVCVINDFLHLIQWHRNKFTLKLRTSKILSSSARCSHPFKNETNVKQPSVRIYIYICIGMHISRIDATLYSLSSFKIYNISLFHERTNAATPSNMYVWISVYIQKQRLYCVKLYGYISYFNSIHTQSCEFTTCLRLT